VKRAFLKRIPNAQVKMFILKRIPAFKDCRGLDSRAFLWLVRAWIRIPLAAAFAVILKGPGLQIIKQTV